MSLHLLNQVVTQSTLSTSSSSPPLQFVACHLQRLDLHHAWGLWVSLRRDNKLVVEGVRPHVFQPLLQWCMVTATPPEPHVVTNQNYGISLWKSYFALLKAAAPQRGCTDGLQAGDSIFSINGLPIPSFGSLDGVTAYLQECHQIFIVAIRQGQPARLLCSPPSPQSSVVSGMSAVPPSSRLPSQQQRQRGQAGSLIRVVTPPKSEVRIRRTRSNTLTAIQTKLPVQQQQHLPKVAVVQQLPAKRVLELPIFFQDWKNPMFRKEDDDEGMPYCDNNMFDSYDGSRSRRFLFHVNSSNFDAWLRHRKWKWRSRWNIEAAVLTNQINSRVRDCQEEDFYESCTGPAGDTAAVSASALPPLWVNTMFDKRYDDNLHYDPYDGRRSRQFLLKINSSNIAAWLHKRKISWKNRWNVYTIEEPDHQKEDERLQVTVPYDFWTAQQYASFDHWLTASTAKWKKSYSWNSRKRKRIQQVCEEVVHFPSSSRTDPQGQQETFQQWLRVRKNQWRMLRRKRQRRIEEQAILKAEIAEDDVNVDNGATISPMACDKHTKTPQISDDFVHIDALLEEEERKKKLMKARKPIDVSFLFDPSIGCPDDVAAHCLEYLERIEHGKLLCISKSFAKGLQSRQHMWQLLCSRSHHWHLPRRPRKPWHELYLTKLRMELQASQKQNDDLLTKVADVLLKGDQLKVVQRLIESAEKKFSFDVNYLSGVVCERNGLLNLAVIHKRHKIVHWLVEQKNADIETSDRGHFTPLINAAWGGDKHLVRFFLHHGADRQKVGTGHYSQGLASKNFKGFTAEGWARERGHAEIAELIRVGL